jgi:hypothetical protein
MLMDAFIKGDVYIDYPFEQAKFRYEKESGRVNRRFYGQARRGDSAELFSLQRLRFAPASRSRAKCTFATDRHEQRPTGGTRAFHPLAAHSPECRAPRGVRGWWWLWVFYEQSMTWPHEGSMVYVVFFLLCPVHACSNRSTWLTCFAPGVVLMRRRRD